MTFEQAQQYIASFVNYEQKIDYSVKTAFKIERVKKFLSNLGDPQDRLSVIHVAGTKGKGSTACFIATILKEAGFNVGLYTSPHLVSLRERIRILSQADSDGHPAFPGMIPENDFASLLQAMRPQIEFFQRSFQQYGPLTFFEILTGLALEYFYRKKVDFVVLETGLGGRFDATNATSAMMTVLTPISFDHEKLLGSTVSEIAYEKAGIIKASNRRAEDGLGYCVCAPQLKESWDVIRRRSKAQNVKVLRMGRDFYARELGYLESGLQFFYKGLMNEPAFFKTGMAGSHQVTNAAVAAATCESLAHFGFFIPETAIREGIARTFWPGRLEIVQRRPVVVLDGAHNRDSAFRLARYLKREFEGFRKWVVLGVSDDKDVRGIVEHLEPLAHQVVLTRADNPRAADPQSCLKVLRRQETARVTSSVREAVETVVSEMGPEDVAVITGSLFVVGEARQLWHT